MKRKQKEQQQHQHANWHKDNGVSSPTALKTDTVTNQRFCDPLLNPLGSNGTNTAAEVED